MLDKFPAEVLGTVLQHVRNRKDLKNLCEVSRYLCRMTTERLYESVIISSAEPSFASMNIEFLLKRGGKQLKFTRNLQIKALLQKELGSDNMHYNAYELDDDACSSEKLGAKLYPVIALLKRDRLHSFSWELGTCIPPLILRSLGDMATCQRRLECLSLVTDRYCSKGSLSTADLLRFDSLRRLSWIGISPSDFGALGDWLETNANQLYSLVLDFVNQDRGLRLAMPDVSSVSRNSRMGLLGILDGKLSTKFDSLRSLSLAEISLNSSGEALANALNWETLRELKIRNCSRARYFIDDIVQLNCMIGLKTFELAENEALMFGDQIDSIVQFLGAFSGLECFHISLFNFYEEYWEEIAEVLIEHHQSTLRRLVVHGRELELDEDYNELDTACDSDIDIRGPFLDVAFFADVQCFGISTYSIKSFESRFGDEITSKHMQRLPVDLLAFAQFAFSNSGLSGLRVLAYGNFSHDSRSGAHNALLCRKFPLGRQEDANEEVLTFRKVTADDLDLYEILNEHMESIQACVLQSLTN